MKKLMVAIAVGMMATLAANAAKVKWGFLCEAEYDDAVAAADVSGMNAYLIYAPDWDASNVGGSLGKALASIAVGDLPGFTYDLTAGDEYVAYAYNKTSSTLDPAGDTSLSDDVAGSSKDFYVVFADDSKYAAYSDAAYVSPDSDNDQNRDGAIVPVAFVAAADLQDYGSTPGPGPGPEPGGVPEPTSGILLLVGLAGLALKRKIA